MIWYLVVDKGKNVVTFVETALPPDGAYNKDVFDIVVYESDKHPTFEFDENGNPISPPPDDAVQVADFKSQAERLRDLETNNAALKKKIEALESTVTTLETSLKATK